MLRLLAIVFLSQISSATDLPKKCSSVYTFSLQENIELYNLNELVKQSNIDLQGIYLQGHVFRIKKFSEWKEVNDFYKKIPMSDRKILSRISVSRQTSFSSLLNTLISFSKSEKADLKYRFKEIDSLKEKIFDRVESFNRKGLDYTLSDLSDVVGFRITTSQNSRLLKLSSKKEWASVLGIAEGRIIEVEVKGSSADYQLGRFYTAVHLNILGSNGENFELQIMSKPMVLWHKWDHENVYKPKVNDQKKLFKLKQYSVAWAQFILGLNQSDNFVILDKSKKDSVLEFDSYLRKKNSLSSNEGFSREMLYELQQSLE
jgi:ppGpp synthetase/RelA/SpoT-type nucleotidyltranferase